MNEAENDRRARARRLSRLHARNRPPAVAASVAGLAFARTARATCAPPSEPWSRCQNHGTGLSVVHVCSATAATAGCVLFGETWRFRDCNVLAVVFEQIGRNALCTVSVQGMRILRRV